MTSDDARLRALVGAVLGRRAAQRVGMFSDDARLRALVGAVLGRRAAERRA